MSSNNTADRLAALYARATTPTLCDALDQVLDADGAEYVKVRAWITSELERRSVAADAAAEKALELGSLCGRPDYSRAVSRAARADVEAGCA